MQPVFDPLPWPAPVAATERLARATAFADLLRQRRTVRDYAPDPVPREVIAECLRAAGSAPSGANMQPWHFVAVGDPALKRRIRESAEVEEREFYAHRAPPEWIEALAPLGTGSEKPFLEVAPWLIAVFAERWHSDASGRRVGHYYVSESVGIATGMLIAALHHAGLATLTHTPSPMGFLNDLLRRPASERAFLLLVTGYPAPGAKVPRIGKKAPAEYVSWIE